LKTKAIPYS